MARDEPGARSLLANASFVGLTHGASRALHLLLLAVIGRSLGVDGLGAYAAAAAFGSFAVFLTDFGLSPRLAREVAARPEIGDALFQRSAGLKLASIAVALPVGLLMLLAAGEGFADPALALTMLLAGIVESFSVLNNAVCQAHRRFDLEAAAASLQSVVWVGGGLTAVWLSAPLVVVGFAALAGSVAELLLSSHFASRFRRGGISRPAGEDLRETLPYAVTSFTAVGATQLDVLIVAMVARPEVVGAYAAVARLLHGLAFFPHLFATVALPHATHRLVTRPEAFEVMASGLVRLGLVGAGASVAVLVPLSPAAMRLVYGPDLAALHPLLVAGSAFLFLRTVWSMAACLFTASGRQRQRAKSLLTGLAVTALGIGFATGPAGPVGAVLALAVGEGAALLLFLVERPSWLRKAGTSLATVALGLGAALSVSAWLGPTSLGIAAALLSYAAVLAVSGQLAGLGPLLQDMRANEASRSLGPQPQSRQSDSNS